MEAFNRLNPSPIYERELSLREFTKQAWHVVEPGRPFQSNWHIDAISDHLEAQTDGIIRKLIINMPPRHMKSLCVGVFWMAWEWTFKPHSRWLTTSYSGSLSVRDNIKARRVLQSPWYRRNWGHVFQLSGDQNAKIKFENNRSGWRIASSVKGANTGEGGDHVVFDDPHNTKEVESDTKRLEVIEWYDGTMVTRADPLVGVQTAVGQRTHEEDLFGHLLTSDSGWELLKLPARYEPRAFIDLGIRQSKTSLNFKDPRTKQGELLHEARFNNAAIAEIEKSLQYRAAGQLQQEPTSSEGGLWKRHWWRYWYYPNNPQPPVRVRREDGTLFECQAIPLPARFDKQIQSWDMAFKDTKASSFVVGQVWGKVGAYAFLLDQDRDKMDFTETLRRFIALCQKWPKAYRRLIEDKANGPAVINALHRKLSGLIPVQVEGSKEARASAVAPDIESGNVFLPHPNIAGYTSGFIREGALTPNGAYWDQVDAAGQALTDLFGKRGSFVQF